ncbi:MAG: cell division protein FtsA [Spirochaetes bacterium GWB1_48_6]|nr:MAG: cell division protein FtsA [Spirochaetes bacterium GWB1_48_6]
MDELVVGLDMGTSQIRCAIGTYDEEGRLEIVSHGVANSEGLRNGVVVSIKAALKSVQEAVEKAEEKGYEVKEVLVGMSGGTVEGLNSRGVVAVAGGEEITQDDMDRVLEAAKAVLLPMDREILHVLPQEYIVDDVGKIKNPLEMMGIRLESEVHIVTAGISAIKNLVNTVNNAGFTVTEVVLESLASSTAVLSKEERDVGVLLIDFGAGTTDAILFLEGAPRYSKIIPLGSERVTKDLAQVLQIPEEEAERIKVQDGCATLSALKEDTSVIVNAVGTRPAEELLRSEICQIIQPRMEEIFSMIHREITKAGFHVEQLGGGVVITGGGANMEGICEVAHGIFGRHARIGTPFRLKGLDPSLIRPEMATALGLVMMRDEQLRAQGSVPSSHKNSENQENIFSRIMNWFSKRMI